MKEDANLVAGRVCGPCNVCCVVPTIDEPALQKLPGYRCENARRDGGCTIYLARPNTCRAFFCGWRRLKWIGEALRPDLSGVFVRLAKEATLIAGVEQDAVSFTLLDAASLEATGLAEAVAAAIHNRIGTYLIVPGPPGHGSSRVRINEALADAVAGRDKAAILRMLAELRREGASAAHRPVILASNCGTDPA
jgi:Fe-S-cluster containining protein